MIIAAVAPCGSHLQMNQDESHNSIHVHAKPLIDHESMCQFHVFEREVFKTQSLRGTHSRFARTPSGRAWPCWREASWWARQGSWRRPPSAGLAEDTDMRSASVALCRRHGVARLKWLAPKLLGAFRCASHGSAAAPFLQCFATVRRHWGRKTLRWRRAV